MIDAFPTRDSSMLIATIAYRADVKVNVLFRSGCVAWPAFALKSIRWSRSLLSFIPDKNGEKTEGNSGNAEVGN